MKIKKVIAGKYNYNTVVCTDKGEEKQYAVLKSVDVTKFIGKEVEYNNGVFKEVFPSHK